MKPDFSNVCNALALPASPSDWREKWDAYTNSLPDPEFSLDAAFLADVIKLCKLSEEPARAIIETAAWTRQNPGATAMTDFLFRHFFSDPAPTPQILQTWPFVSHVLPAPSAMLPALVLATGAKKIRSIHAKRGISEAISRDTFFDLEIWMRDFFRHNGYWGLKNLPWLLNHWTCRLFRIGRLQFVEDNFPNVIRVFQETDTGRVLALAEPGGARFRQDGLWDGTQDIFDPDAWLPVLTITPAAITGQPIDPAGYAQNRNLTLPAKQWRQALKPGDPILSIHIPEGGPMDFDACGESLAQAPTFFARHFPEHPKPAAFHCSTWFFDSQLQSIMPPHSNIIRFQREFYLYPALSSENETFNRVFGSMPPDLRTAPRDTSLRRAILDFTLAGNHLRCASGFRLMSAPPWGAA